MADTQKMQVEIEANNSKFVQAMKESVDVVQQLTTELKAQEQAQKQSHAETEKSAAENNRTIQQQAKANKESSREKERQVKAEERLSNQIQLRAASQRSEAEYVAAQASAKKLNADATDRLVRLVEEEAQKTKAVLDLRQRDRAAAQETERLVEVERRYTEQINLKFAAMQTGEAQIAAQARAKGLDAAATERLVSLYRQQEAAQKALDAASSKKEQARVEAERLANAEQKLAEQQRLRYAAMQGDEALLIAQAKAKGLSAEATERLVQEQRQLVAQQQAHDVALAAGSSRLDKYGNTAKQTAAALRQVPAQITDIVVSLQGGQAPLTVLLQQGGQLRDIFGGIAPAVSAVGRALLSLINPFTVTAAAAAGLAYAYYQYNESEKEARKSTVASVASAVTLKDAMSTLSGAIGEVGSTVRTFNLDPLYEQFNKASDAVKAATVEQLRFQQAFLETSRLVADRKFSESLADIGGYGTGQKLLGTFGLSGTERIAEDLGISKAAAESIAPVLQGLKNESIDVGLAFREIGQELLKGNKRAVDFAVGLRDASKSQAESAAASSALSKALQDMADGYAEVEDKKKKTSARSDADQYLDQLRRQLDTVEKISEVEKLTREIQRGNIKDLTASQREQLFNAARLVDEEKARVESQKEQVKILQQEIAFINVRRSYQSDIDRQRQQLQAQAAGFGQGARARSFQSGIDQINQRYASERSQALSTYLSNLSDPVKSQEAGKIYADQLALIREYNDEAVSVYRNAYDSIAESENDWMRGSQEAMINYAESLKKLGTDTEQLFSKAFKGMEDAMTEFVMTGKLSFSDLANSIIADLVRIAVRQTIMPGLVSGIGSVMSLFGMPALTPSPRASGGPVFSNSPYLVGEQGPELFVPSSSGSIVPNGALSGGGIQINVNNNAGSDTRASATASQDAGGNTIIDIMVERVEAGIGRRISQGGGMAPMLERRYGLNPAAGALR